MPILTHCSRVWIFFSPFFVLFNVSLLYVRRFCKDNCLIVIRQILIFGSQIILYIPFSNQIQQTFAMSQHLHKLKKLHLKGMCETTNKYKRLVHFFKAKLARYPFATIITQMYLTFFKFAKIYLYLHLTKNYLKMPQPKGCIQKLKIFTQALLTMLVTFWNPF